VNTQGTGRLTSSEIHWVAVSYIGVANGYLGDFSYRTHREFYPAFCDLKIDPEAYPGPTTRERFIQILTNSDSRTQAAILRGVALKYPVESEAQRNHKNYQHLLNLIRKCSSELAVDQYSLRVSSEVVQRALADAAMLIEHHGPGSAVDRVHTALHGYLKAACSNAGVAWQDGATITHLFKALRQSHPAFAASGPHAETTTKIHNSLSSLIDALNPARNHGSLAHANQHLLDREEATLVVNAARTILQYLDAKLAAGAAPMLPADDQR
jgi:hypothetical protein